MLVAGPGFGKTILTEQWATGDRKVAWVRSSRPSADVAVLSRQLAAAGSEIVPGCDRRLTERLNATQDPAGELGVLIDLLSEDLGSWPDDAWIVIDDYHHIRESSTAEAFVEGIVAQAPVQVLISTRDRPTWVSTRSILYGDVLEIGQTMLAMTEDEVTEMLAGVRDEMTSGLLALAGGWPAVIGLASLTTSDSSLPEEHLELPGQLYEFFADEVYRGLEPDVRNGLGLLATAPSSTASSRSNSSAPSVPSGSVERRSRSACWKNAVESSSFTLSRRPSWKSEPGGRAIVRFTMPWVERSRSTVAGANGMQRSMSSTAEGSKGSKNFLTMLSTIC
jgi:ATP/maltotriose-dependent transcriptional regulator MalT